MEFLHLYASTLFLFLIATVILFFFNLKNWRPNYFNFLSACYILTIVSLVSDILWSFTDGKQAYVFWNHLFTITEQVCFAFTGYFWLMYCFHQCKFPWVQKGSRLSSLLALIPVLISTFLMIASVKTGWVYRINEEFHYERGPLVLIRQLGRIYLIIASIMALSKREQTDLPLQRRHYLVIASFCVAPAILGFFEMLAPPVSVPSTQFSIFLSLFIIYVEEQDSKITRDGLTMLRNRFEFDRILKDRMLRSRRAEGMNLYVLGGDLNKFKLINDTYGHLTGDRALQITAHVLDRVGANYDAVVARISGDEFSALLEAPTIETPRAFYQDVTQALEEACENEPFQLSISMGIVEYDGKMSLLELLETADRRMYVQKRKRKS